MRNKNMKKIIRFLTCFLLLGLFVFPKMVLAEAANLTGLIVGQKKSISRAVFTLTGSREPRLYVLTRPDRLIMDLPDTTLATNLQSVPLNHSVFKHIRYGYINSHVLRLVFDLKVPVEFSVTTHSNHIVLNLINRSSFSKVNNKINKTPSQIKLPKTNLASPSVINKSRKLVEKENQEPQLPKEVISTSKTVITKQKKTIITRRSIARPLVVVIDPGHGGHDSGAVGEHGTKEKEVVLAIAKRLAYLINQEGNMRAVLTRNGDYFVPLMDRLKLARKGRADLFVAIHADSYPNSRATGVSVYALSRKGAVTVAAKWLANKENHSELGGVDLRGLEDQSPVLRSVLIDLAQTATTTGSLRLGGSVLDALDNIANLHYPRVEEAPFLVLKSPDIPSILVETGFLSSPREEEKLRDGAYQNKIALALLNGVKRYIKKYSSAT
jgi:N-acetylmuramoyl-L-alanine amidase